MNAIEIEQIQEALRETDRWLGNLAERLGWRDRQRLYLALRAALHVLRDRLPAEEAVRLGAELPMLIRGLYYEGWHPAGKPLQDSDRDELIQRVHEGVHRDPAIDAEQVMRAVCALLEDSIPESEIEDVKQVIGAPLRHLWPA